MTTAPSLAAIVLAAGKGTRMKSPRAKVLHEVFYRPMLHHVLDAVQPLRPAPTVVIVGHQREQVQRSVSSYPVICAPQFEQLGTGHAVLCAEPYLTDFTGTVLIVCGDSPLLLTRHLDEMLARHRTAGGPLTIMTTRLSQPTNYGRIISDEGGRISAIVEEKDASAEQRLITEINAGLYCVETSFLFGALHRVTSNNSQQERYLTDIVAIAVADGIAVTKYEHPHPFHVLGVNSRVELAQAHREISRRRNTELMASGVTMHNPDSVTVAPTVTVGADCLLTERITLCGQTSLGAGCQVEPGVSIEDADIGAGSRIGAGSVLRGCSLAPGTEVPPLQYISGEHNRR
ncbi:MAG: bifunctional N-acetylglucosamine-1-phosphate uridyltransferase/glucosamine-1-phosphate acetyltransferase [Desulfofustis sp.]|nr:bifunctional N-acetylglucosamine-1-phosphate uridyltransferase/glucosamine-1-phosphate acetyltransferase [Desulfofustis sp.]